MVPRPVSTFQSFGEVDVVLDREPLTWEGWPFTPKSFDHSLLSQHHQMSLIGHHMRIGQKHKSYMLWVGPPSWFRKERGSGAGSLTNLGHEIWSTHTVRTVRAYCPCRVLSRCVSRCFVRALKAPCVGTDTLRDRRLRCRRLRRPSFDANGTDVLRRGRQFTGPTTTEIGHR